MYDVASLALGPALLLHACRSSGCARASGCAQVTAALLTRPNTSAGGWSPDMFSSSGSFDEQDSLAPEEVSHRASGLSGRAAAYGPSQGGVPWQAAL